VKAIVQSLQNDVFPSLARGFEDLHNIFTPNTLTEGDMSFYGEGLIDITAGDLPEEDKAYQTMKGDRVDQKNRKTWGYGGRVKTPKSLVTTFIPKDIEDKLKALEKLLKKGSKLIKPQSMQGALPNGAVCEASALPGRFMEYTGSVTALPMTLKSAVLQAVSTLLDIHNGFNNPGGAPPSTAAAPLAAAMAAPAAADVQAAVDAQTAADVQAAVDAQMAADVQTAADADAQAVADVLRQRPMLTGGGHS
jgi:hypothetical protein